MRAYVNEHGRSKIDTCVQTRVCAHTHKHPIFCHFHGILGRKEDNILSPIHSHELYQTFFREESRHLKCKRENTHQQQESSWILMNSLCVSGSFDPQSLFKKKSPSSAFLFVCFACWDSDSLSRNSLHRPSWFQAHRDPPAFASVGVKDMCHHIGICPSLTFGTLFSLLSSQLKSLFTAGTDDLDASISTLHIQWALIVTRCYEMLMNLHSGWFLGDWLKALRENMVVSWRKRGRGRRRRLCRRGPWRCWLGF